MKEGSCWKRKEKKKEKRKQGRLYDLGFVGSAAQWAGDVVMRDGIGLSSFLSVFSFILSFILSFTFFSSFHSRSALQSGRTVPSFVSGGLFRTTRATLRHCRRPQPGPGQPRHPASPSWSSQTCCPWPPPGPQRHLPKGEQWEVNFKHKMRTDEENLHLWQEDAHFHGFPGRSGTCDCVTRSKKGIKGRIQ